MTNQTMKPVWRMNTGQGVTSDWNASVALLHGGTLIDHENPIDRYYLGILKFYREEWKSVTAYQTNRAKVAKYGLVGCEECGYSGQRLNKNYDKLIKCQHCNGKGYTLEKIK